MLKTRHALMPSRYAANAELSAPARQADYMQPSQCTCAHVYSHTKLHLSAVPVRIGTQEGAHGCIAVMLLSC